MATTRLGLSGVGVRPYAGFIAKDSAAIGPHDPGTITRLGLFGVQGRRVSFVAKGEAVVTPPTTTALAPVADGTGRTFGGIWPRRIDYEDRRQIADEFKAVYAELYSRKDALPPSEAEELAAAVSTYAPVSAPDIPPPVVIDWDALTEEHLPRLEAMLLMLQGILRERMEDDDLTLLLLSM